MKRPNRSVFAAVALALSATLCACNGPAPGGTQTATTTPAPAARSQSPAASSSAEPTTVAPATAVPSLNAASSAQAGDRNAFERLSTFSGSANDVQYSFDYPVGWRVEEGGETGTALVLGPDGREIAVLTILYRWQPPECTPPNSCQIRPAVYMGDWAGQASLSGAGAFVVRSMAMDLSGIPSDKARYNEGENVYLVTSLSRVIYPVPQDLLTSMMYGIGTVVTGSPSGDGNDKRDVLFTSNHEFGTLQEAQAYITTDEHRKIQAMIASFREQR